MPDKEIKVLLSFQDNATPGLKNVQKSLADTATQAQKTDSALALGSTKAGQSIFNLTEKLRDLKSAQFTEKDISKISSYNQQIKATEQEITKLGSIGTSSFGNIGGGATKAYSALRQIAYILPGIGIAGIISFATGPIIDYVSSLFDATDAMKQLAAQSAEIKKATQGIFESTAKEVTEVNSLIVVLKSETETRMRKLEALQELKKINPDIFNGLKLEHGAVVGLDGAYKSYLVNLQNVIAAKVIQKRLDQAITRLLDLQGVAATTSTKQLLDGLKKVSEARQKALSDAGQPGFANQLKQASDAVENLRGTEIKQVQAQINSLLKDLSQFSSGIKLDTLKPDKVTKDAETITDVIAKLRSQIELLNKEEINFNTDKSKERVNAFLAAVKELVTKFKLDPDSKLINGLFDEAKIAQLGFVVKDGFLKLGIAARKAIKEGIQAPTEPIPIPFSLVPIEKTNILGTQAPVINPDQVIDINGIEAAAKVAYLKGVGVYKGLQDGLQVGVDGLRGPHLDALYDSTVKSIAKLSSDLNSIISSTFADAFSGIADGIGQVIAGQSNDVGNIFKSFLSAMAEGIKAIGEALVKYGIAKTIISSLKISGPAAIALGLGLEVFASALTAKLTIPKFALGGVTPGGTILVGERGPELLTVPSGSTVTPNAQTNSILGGQSIYIPDARISGQDIVISFNRASAANSRNGA